jgi:acyl carrier protein
MVTMNPDEIKDLILKYILEEYLDGENENITYDTPLISSGYVDSFSMVSLLVFIENKFKIKIPPSKATPEAFDSVNKIVELVLNT